MIRKDIHMIKNITAVERDGFDIRTLTVSFEVPDENFDILSAISKAVADYIKTDAGRQTYEHNCECFNLADFNTSVPNEFCEKYGFKKIDSLTQDIEIDWDYEFTSLIDDDNDE